MYIIGDCISEKVDSIGDYLEGLNGHLHLVIGNNDTNLIKNYMVEKYFEEIGGILNTIDEKGRIIVMCHYPIACWEHRNKENCVHIYGHVHKKGSAEYAFMNKNGKAFNAGCMLNNYAPVTLETLIVNNKKHYG